MAPDPSFGPGSFSLLRRLPSRAKPKADEQKNFVQSRQCGRDTQRNREREREREREVEETRFPRPWLPRWVAEQVRSYRWIRSSRTRPTRNLGWALTASDVVRSSVHFGHGVTVTVDGTVKVTQTCAKWISISPPPSSVSIWREKQKIATRRCSTPLATNSTVNWSLARTPFRGQSYLDCWFSNRKYNLWCPDIERSVINMQKRTSRWPYSFNALA